MQGRLLWSPFLLLDFNFSLNSFFFERRFEMRKFKIIVEKHADGYVAYPVGFKGVVVGEGDTYEQALNDVKSAIKFHIETFGAEQAEEEYSEVFTAEVGV